MYPHASRFVPNEFQARLIRSAFRKRITAAETAQRTGKSGAVAFWHRRQAIENPGLIGLMVVPSFKWYRRIMHRICKELFGRDASFHGTDYAWTFRNDSKVVIVTAEDPDGSAEGITAAWASFDETHLYGFEVFEVVIGRISDTSAKYAHLMFVGLPQFNSWVEELAKNSSDAAYFEDVGTDVNADNLLPGYIELMRESLSPAEFERRVKGRKPLPKGRCFPEFIPELWDRSAPNEGGNLIYWEYNPELPTYLGVDFGRKSAVTFRQKDPDLGVSVFFRELMLDDVSTEALAHRINDIAIPRSLAGRGESRILIDRISADPAGSSWQSATGLKDIAILSEIVGMDITYTFDPKKRSIPYGIDLMNSHILNAAGRRRLLMSVDLYESGLRVGHKGRSLTMAFMRSKYPDEKPGHPIKEEPTKDGLDDHGRDAARYDYLNDANPPPRNISRRG